MSLKLWVAMASAALIVILWAVIFVQKIRIVRAVQGRSADARLVKKPSYDERVVSRTYAVHTR